MAIFQIMPKNIQEILLGERYSIFCTFFYVHCRVATVREKYLENEIFFLDREKSGNFVDGQGNLERT